MSGPDFNRIRRKLLFWYDRNRRDLPWRKTRRPYAIWVAETMLQQTQVQTVLPYYRRFLKSFPSLRALNCATLENVLSHWSGLGYYRRAENLKKAARIIMRSHSGRIPADYAQLLALPGIGAYTAGALMSIAFNKPYAALDGNARRVVSRLFGLSEKRIERVATALVAPERPGDFNQAIMDLGATICLPRAPKCAACPLSSFCVARLQWSRRKLKPVSVKRSVRTEWPLVLIVNDGRLILRRRSAGGLLGGLWEVPGGEKKPKESLGDALDRHLGELRKHTRLMVPVGELRHSITYRRIVAPVFRAVLDRDLFLPSSRWRWVPISTLGRYPISSLSLKAARFLFDEELSC
jgi:A/G-specific adenine glycosylase